MMLVAAFFKQVTSFDDCGAAGWILFLMSVSIVMSVAILLYVVWIRPGRKQRAKIKWYRDQLVLFRSRLVAQVSTHVADDRALRCGASV